MKKFAPVLERALARAGGAEALERMLPSAKSARALRARGDDRYLSQMSLRIFRAGLRHAMVDERWPTFEKVFKRFEPRRVIARDFCIGWLSTATPKWRAVRLRRSTPRRLI